jgi:hypothetical protein
MLRRSFMAALGLAPVAAVMPSNPATVPTPYNEYIPFKTSGMMASENLSPLELSRQRLRALKEMQKFGITRYREPFYYERVNAELSSLRSWSSSYKIRVQEDRIIKIRDRVEVEDAEAEVARQMKAALLPEWARRFF